jgi:hypothetical protein
MTQIRVNYWLPTTAWKLCTRLFDPARRRTHLCHASSLIYHKASQNVLWWTPGTSRSRFATIPHPKAVLVQPALLSSECTSARKCLITCNRVATVDQPQSYVVHPIMVTTNISTGSLDAGNLSASGSSSTKPRSSLPFWRFLE